MEGERFSTKAHGGSGQRGQNLQYGRNIKCKNASTGPNSQRSCIIHNSTPKYSHLSYTRMHRGGEGGGYSGRERQAAKEFLQHNNTAEFTV